MISLIVLSAPQTGLRSAGTMNGDAIARDPAEAVVRTLSAFVGAAVRGLVRDAVLLGSPQDDLRLIADHAGCAFAAASGPEGQSGPEGLAAALNLARAAHLLVIRAGYVPETGFAEAVEDLLRFGEAEKHGWVLRAAAERPIEKILPHLAPAAGLLAPRNLCLRAKASGFPALLAATRARPAPRLRLWRVA